MNRLGRDTQMYVHITKRQKYAEPNIRFGFPPGLHITGVQMSLLQSKERATLMMSMYSLYVTLFKCVHMIYSIHTS